jgi:hypothetical protein
MKTWFAAIFSFWVVLSSGTSCFGQQDMDPSASLNFERVKNQFIQNLVRTIPFQAAQLAFDYSKRPVMGVIVSDFYDPAGKEVVVGNEIAAALRATLSKGKQFYVYGREDTVSQNLKISMSTDPQWKTTAQRKFQWDLMGLEKFKSFPVDLIITGQVSPEKGNQLKVVVSLIPFFTPIKLVETESERTDILKTQFISPILSTEEVSKSFAPYKNVQTGRLVVVSLLNVKRGRDVSGESKVPLDSRPTPDTQASRQKTWDIKAVNDVSCWLGEKELKVREDNDWEHLKKKEYQAILGGLGADTLWYDDSVEEGTHSLFFSLVQGPAKKQYKTFSKSFSIKGGTSNYLFFFLQADLKGEPTLQVRFVCDPENRPLPFN